MSKASIIKLSFVLSISCIALFFYISAASGPFLHDDFANLMPLEQVNQNDSFQSALRFIFGNTSGRLGRPISMVSFYLNASGWPNNPFFFKLTNIIIHFATAASIFLFLKLLIPHIDRRVTRRNTLFLAITTALFWLVHPLHVSTTLYVIQRMTQLSTIFTLISLITYLKYKKQLETSTRVSPFIIPSILITLTISLGVFSKENAVLVFPSILLISYFSKPQKPSKLYNYWLFLFAMLPAFICIIYVFSTEWEQLYLTRQFTFLERLLTESRVLVHYLKQIVIPNYISMSIFHDDFILSESITSPITTLWSLMFLTTLIALLFSKINQIYKFSIIWFITWHLLESTVVPLEIYYEHRNYLASIGPILAVSKLLTDLVNKDKPRISKLSISATFIYGLFLIVQLGLLTSIWKNENKLYSHWFLNHENSNYINSNMIQIIENRGNYSTATKLTEVILRNPKFKNDFGLNFRLYMQQCILEKNTNESLLHLSELALDRGNYSVTATYVMNSLSKKIKDNSCKPQNLQRLNQLLDKVIANNPLKYNAIWLSNFNHSRSEIYYHFKKYKKSLKYALEGFKFNNTNNTLLRIIHLNILLKDKVNAQKYINIAIKQNNSRNKYDIDISSYINSMEKRLLDLQ